jgi:indole-3-glycerol phosphate synthase
MILDEIVAHKRMTLPAQKESVPLAHLQELAAGRPPPLSLATALRRPGVSLIAEVKRASPSKGLFAADLDPVHQAETYVSGGAAAISVLTDERFFRGTLQDLTQVRCAVANTGAPVPVLRKDFIIDPYQVIESRAHGADALLLIAAILSQDLLSELLALTHELGMTALVEVHDQAELEWVLQLSPQVVGINNRNLEDFSVDMTTFERLRPQLPREVVAVAESGVKTKTDLVRLQEMGADAVLIGESLVTAPNVPAKVREFVEAGRLNRSEMESEGVQR